MNAKPQTITAGPAAPDAMTQALAAFAGATGLYQTWSRSCADLAACQLENGRELLIGSLEDIDLVSQATTPEAVLHAELAVLRRRARRASSAMERFLERMDASLDAMTHAARTMQNGERSDGHSA